VRVRYSRSGQLIHAGLYAPTFVERPREGKQTYDRPSLTL